MGFDTFKRLDPYLNRSLGIIEKQGGELIDDKPSPRKPAGRRQDRLARLASPAKADVSESWYRKAVNLAGPIDNQVRLQFELT